MKQLRRKFGLAIKAELALGAVKGIRTISEIAQHYELHPVQVSQSKTEFLAHSVEVFEGEKKHCEEIERLKSERDELFKQIG
jgi:transposase